MSAFCKNSHTLPLNKPLLEQTTTTTKLANIQRLLFFFFFSFFFFTILFTRLVLVLLGVKILVTDCFMC